MRACDQISIFSTGGKFRFDYKLLLELNALFLLQVYWANGEGLQSKQRQRLQRVTPDWIMKGQTWTLRIVQTIGQYQLTLVSPGGEGIKTFR